MKALRRWASDGWRTIAIISSIVLLVGGLLLFRLDSQTPAASPSEAQAVKATANLQQIMDNPTFAPHKTLQYGLGLAGWDNLFAMRLVSVLFGLAVIISFYFLLKLWTTPLLAVLGTLLLFTSGWFLHYARLATPEVLYGTLLILVALGASLEHSRWRKLTLLTFIAVSALALYIPGLIWFVLAGLVWRRKLVLKELKRVPWAVTTMYVLLFAALLVPLVWAISRDLGLIRLLLGLPAELPNVLEFIRRLLNVPVQILLRGPADPVVWLGRLPLLDIFSSVMAIAGGYVILRKWQFDRSKLLVGVLVLGAILMALGGPVQTSLLTPFIYAIVAIGIAYMLEEWLSVFPRNPIARKLGAVLIIAATAVACFYHVRLYFVAWHNAPATKAAYTVQLP